jgi:hypothetical protein
MDGPSSAMMTEQARASVAAVNPYNPYAAQPLYLGNDFSIVFSGPPRCIWTTLWWEMITRSFLALHEASESMLSCAGCAACLT